MGSKTEGPFWGCESTTVNTVVHHSESQLSAALAEKPFHRLPLSITPLRQ